MGEPGIPDRLIEGFLARLERRGRGSYTARSYRLGLADFSRWLVGVDREVAAVGRGDVGAYIGEFAAGAGNGRAATASSI